MLLVRGGQGLLAVGRRDDLVALAGEPGLEDLDVRRVVVDDQDAGGCSHGSSLHVTDAASGVVSAVRESLRAEHPEIKLEQLAAVVLARTPLGALVRAVAGIRASVHTKLMAAFLVVTLLFIAMGAFSVRTVLETREQSRQLDQAHERVAWSQQIEQALARQMHFSELALLSQDEAAIARILRENNRFNETLAKLDAAGLPEQHDLVEQIRASQDEAMAVVADMANAIRDRKLGDFTRDLLGHQERIDGEITARVARLVAPSRAAWPGCATASRRANRDSLVTHGRLSPSRRRTRLALRLRDLVVLHRAGARGAGLPARVAAGDFSGRIDVRNRDEFGALARAHEPHEPGAAAAGPDPARRGRRTGR